ncbi:MAG: hypothetical protein FJZ57_00200 [Chlamydiae bacterium]|nr:hypothetical protein [Chlamydiota bacterium]
MVNVIKDANHTISKGVSKAYDRFKRPSVPLDFTSAYDVPPTTHPDADVIAPFKKSKTTKDVMPALIGSPNAKEARKSACAVLGKISASQKSSTISPVGLNDMKRQIGDRTSLSKKESCQTVMAITAQVIIANQIDETLGTPQSYYCIDLDHVVDGEVNRKSGPKGRHVMSEDPSISIEKVMKFNEHISIIDWKNNSISPKSKISTCFSDTIISPTDGTPGTSDTIKQQLLDIFDQSEPTAYNRLSDNGASFIKKFQTSSSNHIYLEALKESPSSHTINTFYPVAFFEHAPLSSDVKIYQEALVGGNIVPLTISHDEFKLIFKQSITSYLSYLKTIPADKIAIKTPIRYKNELAQLYVIDGALGLKTGFFSFIPTEISEFFPEGFYAEFPVEDVDSWIQTTNPSCNGDVLLNIRSRRVASI